MILPKHTLLRLLVLLSMLMLSPLTAFAQGGGGDSGKAAEIDKLVKTLEDPEARGKLINQLQALTEVQGRPTSLPMSMNSVLAWSRP